MPKTQHSSLLPEVGNGKLVAIRRALLSQTLKLLEPVMIGGSEPAFDDAVTAFMLISIGAGENDTHIKLPHWLNLLNYCVKKLNLCAEPDGFGEEEKEERRRYVNVSLLSQNLELILIVRQVMVGFLCHRSPCVFIIQPPTPNVRSRMPHFTKTMS